VFLLTYRVFIGYKNTKVYKPLWLCDSQTHVLKRIKGFSPYFRIILDGYYCINNVVLICVA